MHKNNGCSSVDSILHANTSSPFQYLVSSVVLIVGPRRLKRRRRRRDDLKIQIVSIQMKFLR